MSNIILTTQNESITKKLFLAGLIFTVLAGSYAPAYAQTGNSYWTVMSYSKNITGNSLFSSYTFANPGDEIEFETRVNVSGTISGIQVNNIIPSHMTYISGTLKVDGNSMGDSISSVNLGTVANRMVYVNLRARVNDQSSFPNTRTVLTFAADSVYNSVTRSDTASVQVSNVPIAPSPVTQSYWSIITKAKNVTNTSYFSSYIFADPGDEMEFEVRIFVTKTVNGIIVNNVLPSRLSYVYGSLKVDGITSGNNITSINLGNRTDSSVYINFRARVADLSSFSNSRTLLTFTAESAQGSIVRSDSSTIQVSNASDTTISRGLTITKYAKNLSSNQAQAGLITVHEGDTIEYRIEVRNNGNTAYNNVTVSDRLSSRLTYVDNSFRFDGVSVNPQNFFSVGFNMGTINAYSLKTITYQAVVANGSNGTTLTNQATVKADNVSSVSDVSKIVVNNSATTSGGSVSGIGIDLVFTKKALNFTQSVDAEKVIAKPNDQIVFTLAVENKGSAPASNFVIEDNVGDLLQYADFADVSDAIYYSSDQALRWPAVTVNAGQKIERSFVVKIKPTISGSDMVISNTYGNTVKISLKKGVYTAPATGPSVWVSALMALAVMAGFALYRVYKAKISNGLSLESTGDKIQ